MSLFGRLGEKSWVAPSAAGDLTARAVDPAPAAKTGLAFFIAVLTSMFLLFVVGYRMRMAEPDWVAVKDPALLWVNTGLLILASLAMQGAKAGATAGRIRDVRNRLSMAGFITLVFLVGQYMAWVALRESGLFALQSPAAAFFILLTGLHALHLCGGLLVWARATWRAWQGVEVKRIQLSVELCTTYWHYLLLVWLVFFTLLLAT